MEVKTESGGSFDAAGKGTTGLSIAGLVTGATALVGGGLLGMLGNGINGWGFNRGAGCGCGSFVSEKEFNLQKGIDALSSELAKEKAERERKEQEEREREQRNKEAAERYWARKAAEDEERKRQYLEEQTKRQQQQGTPHKDEILPLIDTNTLAVDSTGNRWVKCTVCGKISPSCVFAFVGEDAAHPNYGRCNACTGKRTR